MYDGFDNVPKMMGSTPRIKGKVTDWKSGFKEGGKAFSLGLWDGIVGLGVEPVDGAMREGWTGLGKGFGRGGELSFFFFFIVSSFSISAPLLISPSLFLSLFIFVVS